MRLFLTNDISLLKVTLQTAIFGFINGIENNVYTITDHILLIFKLQVYEIRERDNLDLSRLINDVKKLERYNNKLEKTHRTL